jgi:GDP-mannose transporter
MKKAQRETKLSEWGSAYYNNLLSVGVLGIMCILNGEVFSVSSFPYLLDPMFMSVVIFSGAIGTGLSLSVFWLVSATSPTTYSMIGALNKIPITFVSMIFFHLVLSAEATVSLMIGLLSGVVYAYAKYKEQEAKRASLPPLTTK